jgi:hypothetical protein
MTSDLCHASQLMGGSDLFWGFHRGFTRSLVHKTSDILNPNTSIF